MTMNTLRRFDGKALVELLRDKHNARGPVGVVASFGRDVLAHKDAGNYDVEAIATTDDVDLSDEVVLPGGCDASYLLKNRKLFVDHGYSIADAVGVLRYWNPWKPGEAVKGWKLRAALLRNHPYPAPQAIMNMIDAGGGIGMSIGFEMLEGSEPTEQESLAYGAASYIIRKWRCLEVSFTAMPCNVSCQTMTGMRDESAAEKARLKLTQEDRRVLSIVDRPRLKV
jgi:hypothetical protein